MNYLLDFCKEFDYPAEATSTLQSAYKAILDNDEAYQTFSLYVTKYENDVPFDHYKALDEIERSSQNTGIHPYTVKFLFYLRLSKKLKLIYSSKNLNDEIYHNTMLDLKWKLTETHDLYGIWGAFVAHWFRELFTLERFALGRLQFDIVQLGEDYCKGDISISKDEYVVNVHIPPMGKLDREACIDAYNQAYDFFSEYRVNEKMVFCCHSWLLHPALKAILPKNSNILKFNNDYDILRIEDKEVFTEGWRIFYCDCNITKIEDYPENTTLQRSVKKWLLDGNKLGSALGAFVFDKSFC